jgi:hypothetical protein
MPRRSNPWERKVQLGSVRGGERKALKIKSQTITEKENFTPEKICELHIVLTMEDVSRENRRKEFF